MTAPARRARPARRSRLQIAVPLLLLALGALALLSLTFRDAQPAALQAVQESVLKRGAYAFDGRLQLTQRPQAVLENVGLPTRQQDLSLEGEVDVRQETSDLRVFGGPQDAAAQNVLEMHTANGVTRTRIGDGVWSDTATPASGLIGDDMLIYLEAARNVSAGEQALVAGQTLTRYTFEVDPRRYAELMSERMQREAVAEQGLPANARLQLADIYLDMTGSGEIWVDAAGLPVRQILRLSIPDTASGQLTETTLTVNFMRFAPLSPWSQLPLWVLAVEWDVLFLQALLLTLTVAGALALGRGSRSRPAYAAMTLMMLVSTLVSPLLQAGQWTAYAAEQQEQQQEQQTQQAQVQQAQTSAASQQTYRAGFDPSRSPLRTAPSAAVAPDDDSDGLSNDQELLIGTVAADADSDNDGLSDGIEVLELGTRPTSNDTDGDRLLDGAEVRGFSGTDGRTWYLDPFEADSNHDGLIDFLECDGPTYNTSFTCRDADGDQLPDAFDPDNDNDRIPDRADDAPGRVISGGAGQGGQLLGVQGGAFPFKLAGYTSGKLVAVDMMIRPVNGEHLWYSGHVLDWPTDREGQMQRVHDTTFSSTGAGANGDMRLQPMLEIEIPYDSGNSFGGLPVKAGVTTMPAVPQWTGVMTDDQALMTGWLNSWLDRDVLRAYQVTVRLKDDGRNLVAYVPLDIVRDPLSGSPVAFSARMLYRPLAAFGPAQRARLAWTVETMQDRCTTAPAADDPAGETFSQASWAALSPSQREGSYVAWADKKSGDRQALWCKNNANWTTSIGPIHTYYDDFYVGAFNITEDHGVEIAAALQVDAPGDDTFQHQLWNLARNLDRVFVSGRDCPATVGGVCQTDGVRDVTVAEIKRRFNGGGAGVADGELWGLPRNTFVVETYSFSSEVEQIELMAGHLENGVASPPKLLDLLNQTYVSGGAASVSNPTVLLAREQRFRVGALGANDTTAGGVTTFDISGEPALLQTALKWQPFSYKGAQVWEATDLQTFIDSSGGTYEALLRQYNPTASDAWIAGGVKVAKTFYLALVEGRTGLVERNGTLIASADPALADLSLLLPALPQNALGVTLDGLASLLSASQTHRTLFVSGSPSELIEALGRQVLYQDGGAALSLFEGLGSVGGSNQSLQLFAKTLVGVAETATSSEAKVKELLAGLATAANWTIVVLSFVDVALGLGDALQKVLELAAGTVEKLGNAGLALGIILEVITFTAKLFALLSSGWDTMDIINLVAETALSVALFVIMTVIGGIFPAGTAIAAIIALVDLIIWAICYFTGLEKSENGFAKFFCTGISANLLKLLMFVFWDNVSVIDFKAEGRLDLRNWRFLTRDPVSGVDTGMVAGNIIEIHVDVVTWLTVDSYFMKRVGPALTDLENVLTDSTFRYEFTRVEEQGDKRIDERLDLDSEQMIGDWAATSIKMSPYSTTQTISSSSILTFTHAAINWKPDGLFLAEGYSVDAVTCTLLVACFRYDKQDSTYLNLSKNMIFDVFPRSLDGFHSLTDRGEGGYALAWDAKFPVLLDADGDGLRTKARGGNDPNDGSPDSDADGLSDFYEVQHSAQGFEPTLADADADGLSDYDEVVLGTNPALADVDNDGLTDGQELAGWEIVYGYNAANQPLRFRTGSDPFDPDTDDDGVLDKQEQTYGFNPRVYNSGQVLQVLSEVDEHDGRADGIVADATLIDYTATISNVLRDRYALGLFEVQPPSAAQTSSIPPRSYRLGPQEQTTISGTLQLKDLTISEKTVLVNRAGAIIADLRGLSGGRVLWLRFDEAAGATTFSDSSMLGNAAICATPCANAGATGYSGRALAVPVVDASQARVQVPHAPALAGERLTLSFWVRPASVAATTLVEKQNSYSVGIDGSHRLNLTVTGANCSAVTQLSGTSMFSSQAWMFVTVSYDGTTLKLYMNGVLEGQQIYGGGICQTTTPIMIGGAGTSGINARFDEFSLYPYALTPAEVQAQFTAPILQLSFDGNIADGSTLSHPTQMNGRPNLTTPNSRNGDRAAQFDKKRWIDIGNSSTLDLSTGTGNFTLATWINPVPMRPDAGTWVGLLGREAGASTYPSLYMRFDSAEPGTRGSLKATFGNGSTLCESGSTNTWVEQGTWQHVAVAFDGAQFHFYYNGVLYESKAVVNCGSNPKPAANTRLYVGRTGPSAQLELIKIDVGSAGDGSDTAEYYAKWDGGQFWSNSAVDDYTTITLDEPPAINDDDSHRFELWEEDSCASCHDQLISVDMRNSDISMGNGDATKTWGYNADGDGTLTWRLWNTFFNGGMDDVRIYRYALSAQDALDLYNTSRDGSHAVHLGFEEPPTSHLFIDVSGNMLHGLCASSVCPTSGLPGRDGQAVRFEGDSALKLADHPALDMPSSFTVAAWVKLDGTSARQIVASKYHDVIGGFELGVQNGQLSGRLRDPLGNVYSVQGGSVSAGTWTHLALTASAGGSLIGYIDGVQVAIAPMKQTGTISMARAMPASNVPVSLYWGGNFNNEDEPLDIFTSDQSDLSDLSSNINDDGSSVRISDGCVKVFADAHYGGGVRDICDDVSNLGSLNDQVTSLDIYDWPAQLGTPPGETGLWAQFSSAHMQHLVVPSQNVDVSFSSITIAARIRTSWGMIAARGSGDPNDGFRFWYDLATQKLNFRAGNGTWTSNSTVPQNEIHHVAVTLDGSSVKFYIDGVLDSTHATGAHVNDTPERPILIGRSDNCGMDDCRFFGGHMRDVSLYARALSSSEVASLNSGAVEQVSVVARAFHLPLSSNLTDAIIAQPLTTNDMPLTVGRDSSDANALVGLIDTLEVIDQALPESDITALMSRAPMVNLHFDEPLGATSFADWTSSQPSATCAAGACPVAGATGRIRESLVMSGTAPLLTIPNGDHVHTPRYSLELWVRPEAIKSAEQILIAKTPPDGNIFSTNYRLGISPGSLTLTLATCGFTLQGQRDLNQGQWNHIVATFDTDWLRIYINGTLDASLPSTSACITNEPVRIGSLPAYGVGYDGGMDELAIYRYALDAKTVAQHYQYQQAWLDIGVRHELTIDADVPTVAIEQAENATIPNAEILLSVDAFDATSPISAVLYNTGGGWLPATEVDGKWFISYTPPVASGPTTLQVRAIDVVGHQSQSSRTLFVDSTPPTVTLAPSLTSVTLRPVSDDNANLWMLNLSGSVSDTRSLTQTVTVALSDQSGVVGAPLQVVVPNGPWSASYNFPFAPSGRYTLEAYAEDAAGNRSPSQRAVLALDARAPMADAAIGEVRIGDLGPAQSKGLSALSGLLSGGQPELLRGTIGDTPAPKGSLLLAHFEEPAGSTAFLDSSLDQRSGACAASGCPTAIAGVDGGALSFDGTSDTIHFANVFSATSQIPQRFTLSAWVRPTAAGEQVLVSASSGATPTLELRLGAGGSTLTALMDTSGALTPVGQVPLAAGQWSLFTLSFDGERAISYVNGAQVAATPVSGSFAGLSQLWLGSRGGTSAFFQGQVDELALYGIALDDDSVRMLADPVRVNVASAELRLVPLKDFQAPDALPWATVALSQTGVPFTSWSYALPAGIEGHFRADLRTTDSLGNQQIVPDVWSGAIDTLAPRVALLAVPLSNGTTRVICQAEDYHLDGATLGCSIPGVTWAHTHHSEPWFTAYFSPAQQLQRSTATAIVPTSTALSLEACDTFGRCATTTGSATAPITPGVSMITVPTQALLLEALLPVALEGYAQAGDGLSNLRITAGAVEVENRSLPTTPGSLSWNASFTPAAEGVYQLQAYATATGGAVFTDTLAPRIVVDFAPPALAVVTSVITSSAISAPDVAAVSGLVTETAGLTMLEGRVNSGGWQVQSLPQVGSAVPFSAGLALGAAAGSDGQPVVVVLRAEDVAGRTTATTRTIIVDTVAPISTSLTVVPSSTLATISGVARDGSGVALVEVGLLAEEDAGSPELTTWHSAALAQPNAAGRAWSVNVPRQEGQNYLLALRLTDIYGNVRTLSAAWSGDPFRDAPQFTSADPADGTYAVAYSHTLAASGDGPITFSVSGGALPPGLTLNPTTGVLSGTPTLAGSYSFTITASSAWPPPAQLAVTIDIAKAAQTLSFGALGDRTYGDPAFTLAATATSGLAVSYTSQTTGVCTVSGATLTIIAAGTCTIAADQPGNVNYTAAAQVTRSFTVSKATLTATAQSQTRRVNQPNPSLTILFSGFVNGDDAADLATAPTASTTALISSPPGTYPITVGGGADENYTLSYVSGTLTITARDIPHISWNNPASIVYGTPLSAAQLNATASYTNAGTLAGTFSYSPPLGTVLHAGAGQVLTVTFTPTDAVNYESTTWQVQLDVTKAPLTITADNKAVLIGAALPTLTASYAGFVNGDDSSDLTSQPTLSTTANTAQLGRYPITISGATASDYTITHTDGVLSVLGRTFLPLVMRR